MAYQVQLKQFEGPLDLLLHLIARAKVDICDIFVSEITAQYLASMEDIGALDMDRASEFLAMAATLLEIKSRALLPRLPDPDEEGEETPEQALIRRLHEYKAIKESAGQLQVFERAAMAVFSKLPEEYPLPPQSYQLEGLTMRGLVEAFARMMRRTLEEPEVALSPRAIQRDTFSIQEGVFRIAARLRRGPVRFHQLFSDQPSRDEVVTLFLALLEMLRLGRLCIRQDGVFGEILLQPGGREALGSE
ncbi:MAG: segregation/condensation protein A [Oscillospiraceae bacterium]|nr:segregation/condensation protein A [Oscillospiraceae bacterium]